jgi:DNA replication and repair protein RecF
MKVKELRLANFRNLTSVSIDLDSSLNFFLGKNGQGKTNLLEALYLLGNVRSFRQAKNRDLCMFEREGGFVEATIEDELGPQKIKQVLTTKKREFFLNNTLCSRASDIIGQFVFVTFTPQDLSLVRGAPIERRQYVEKCCVDLKPQSLKTVVHYYRALKNKVELLKKTSPSSSLKPWNEILAQHGEILWSQREEFLCLLETRTQFYYRSLSNDRSTVGLRLKYSGTSSSRPDSLLEELQNRQQEEITRRRSVVGPHRDEIIIELNDRPARTFASQGQVRSLVLALKLATIELVKEFRKEWPVVLFDDVDSELDTGRSNNLFELISQTEAQVLVTSTERCSLPEQLLSRSKLFWVSEGTIEVTERFTEQNLLKVVN